ncbi:MAG: hypothetical protein ACE5J0_00990 [Candidatus Paceibacterales bacterium]
MLNQPIKSSPFSNGLLLIGLIFAFLVFFIFCEHLHGDSECNVHFFLTNQISSKENLLIYSLSLSSFVIISVIFFRKYQNLLPANISLSASLMSLWFWQFIFKIYNPILEAFRRGIIHPQIYNFSVVSR